MKELEDRYLNYTLGMLAAVLGGVLGFKICEYMQVPLVYTLIIASLMQWVIGYCGGRRAEIRSNIHALTK